MVLQFTLSEKCAACSKTGLEDGSSGFVLEM